MRHLRAAGRGRWQASIVTALALGYAKAWRAQIAFDDRHQIYVCSGMRTGFGRAGTTLGGAYLTRCNVTEPVLRHEAVHADQWARYGFGFALRYLVEELRNPKDANKFEREAGLADGGYCAPDRS
ncbi:hypothetical protein FOS14_15435 [Skermania sp. ID1734]|nr:hypothetical protein FOS14_15435 [Skermania sp. ID1734]